MYSINETELIQRKGIFVSKKEVYSNYQKNKPLELERVLNESRLYISSENTIFIDQAKIEYLRESELLTLIKQLRAAARDNGVKLPGINKLAKNIREGYSKYESFYNDYNDRYKLASYRWENHVIREGYSNDFYYYEILAPLSSSLNPPKNKEIYKVARLASDIRKYIECIPAGRFTSINLESLEILVN